ncbi:MAG: DUF3108 domain-containing protein [Helicobacteraceae bacterium]|nr:DUF3108 domain-containing protein [Helicobacteraceae bacterium]
MIRLLTVLTLLTLSLQATSMSAKYDVTFGFFGKIGEADMSYKNDSTKYKIKIDVRLSEGFINSLANDRKESLTSTGVVKNGVLVPMKYLIERSWNDKNTSSLFIFNHKEHYVNEHRAETKVVTQNHVDIMSLSIVPETKVEKSSSITKLPFYASNDFQSLMFNLKTFLKSVPVGDRKETRVIGSNNNEGKILILHKKITQADRELFHEKLSTLVGVVINQDIFAKDSTGELLVNFDKNEYIQEAILKDILMFGDVKLTRKSIKEN